METLRMLKLSIQDSLPTIAGLMISSVAMVTVSSCNSYKRSYPVRSDEGVSLVTNELPANFNDLPKVVLIKLRI